MNVSYTGTDVLFVDGQKDQHGNDICVVIACTKEAEDALYNWQIRHMNQTGKEIGTLRTVFGLTFYAYESQEQKAMKQFIKDKEFKTYYGHV